MSRPTAPRPPSEVPSTDRISDNTTANNPFDDSHEAAVDLNDPDLKFKRFCHFFVQDGIQTYGTPSTAVWLGTFPTEGYGIERGRTYHEDRLAYLTGSSLGAPVVDITFDAYKHKLGLRLHDLTLRIKFEVEDDATHLRVLLCINVPAASAGIQNPSQELGRLFMEAVVKLIRKQRGFVDVLAATEEFRGILFERLKKKPMEKQRVTVKVKGSAVALDLNSLRGRVVPRPSWSNPGEFKFGRRSEGWPQKFF